MIEDEFFNVYITMKSGRKHVFEVSSTELDCLIDKFFGRESGQFQNFGSSEVINVSDIEYLRYEKLKDDNSI